MALVSLVPYKVYVTKRVSGKRRTIRVANSEIEDDQGRKYSVITFLRMVTQKYLADFSAGKIDKYVDSRREKVVCFEDVFEESSDKLRTLKFVVWYGEYGVVRKEIPVSGLNVGQDVAHNVAIAYPFPAKYFSDPNLPYGIFIAQKYSVLGFITILRSLIREELHSRGLDDYTIHIEPLITHRTLIELQKKGRKLVKIGVIGDYVPRRSQDWKISEDGDLQPPVQEHMRSELWITPSGSMSLEALTQNFKGLWNWVRSQSQLELWETGHIFLPKAIKVKLRDPLGKEYTINIDVSKGETGGKIHEALPLDPEEVVDAAGGTLNIPLVFEKIDEYYQFVKDDIIHRLIS